MADPIEESGNKHRGAFEGGAEAAKKDIEAGRDLRELIKSCTLRMSFWNGYYHEVGSTFREIEEGEDGSV